MGSSSHRRRVRSQPFKRWLRRSSRRAHGIGLSGFPDPFNGHIDEFHIAHLQRSDGWIATTWNNISDASAFAAVRPEGNKAGMTRRTAGRRRCSLCLVA
jgi:hypothetical protein